MITKRMCVYVGMNVFVCMSEWEIWSMNIHDIRAIPR